MNLAVSRADAAPQLTVERGLEVLRAFRCERAALTNSELVRRTGLPKATVSRLTTTLLQVGFLRHAAGGRQFELAPAPVAIGHAFLASNDLLDIANPVLQELGDRLNVSVALAVPDQQEMVYVGYSAGKRVATLRMGVGRVVPMGRTASGHAWLWTLAEPEREQRVQALCDSAGERATAMAAGMRNSFAELDATGTCALHGRFQRDVCAVALPIRVGRGGTVMGLSCGAAGLRLDPTVEKRRIAPPLRDAAARLESLLADCDDVP